MMQIMIQIKPENSDNCAKLIEFIIMFFEKMHLFILFYSKFSGRMI